MAFKRGAIECERDEREGITMNDSMRKAKCEAIAGTRMTGETVRGMKTSYLTNEEQSDFEFEVSFSMFY